MKVFLEIDTDESYVEVLHPMDKELLDYLLQEMPKDIGNFFGTLNAKYKIPQLVMEAEGNGFMDCAMKAYDLETTEEETKEAK